MILITHCRINNYFSITMKVNAYATIELGKELKPYTYELGPLPDDYVDVKVTHSGMIILLFPSNSSLINNKKKSNFKNHFINFCIY